jgi:hypothetical protein
MGLGCWTCDWRKESITVCADFKESRVEGLMPVVDSMARDQGVSVLIVPC